MTSPIIHARSSVSRCGGDLKQHMLIHQALDESKIAFCDARHRVVYHHTEGVEYLARKLANSESEALLLNTVGIQHLREDLGGKVACARDWTDLLDLAVAPSPIATYDEADGYICRRFGGDIEDFNPILDWLKEPLNWVGSASIAGIFRHHSFGCFAAESVFGFDTPISNAKKVPVRYITENWIRHVYGKVFSLNDWCNGLPLKSWMNRGYQLDGVSA